MDAVLLRRQFAAMFGPEFYRRFVRALNTTCRCKRRLLYWQERAWCAFSEQANLGAGDWQDDFGAVAGLFHVCDVHDCELTTDQAPVVYGLVCLPDAFLDAREDQFPFANPVAFGGCCETGDRLAEIEFCPECRRRLSAWRRENGDPLNELALAET